MDVLGKCPKCGNDIADGKYGAYCTGKCGFSTKKAFGKELSNAEIKKLLAGKEILLKGLVSKKTGNEYDMYVKPNGTEEYSFTTKEGDERTGSRFVFETRFPEREDSDKNDGDDAS